jgi:hypothetical protein
LQKLFRQQNIYSDFKTERKIEYYKKTSASHLPQKFWFLRERVALAFLYVRFQRKSPRHIISDEGRCILQQPLYILVRL